MAELTFYYGVMGSAKTTQLLTNNFAHKEKGRRTLVLSPIIDSRRERGIVKSRIGISADATDFSDKDDLYSIIRDSYDVVFVDEAQFCTSEQIDQLKKAAHDFCSPVFAYGLRTDFRTQMFSGSKRLLEIADNIIEIPVACQCGRKATVNARIGLDGKILNDGPQVLIGDTQGEVRYEGMCAKCAGVV